ncbi:NADH dehydrogenase [Weissella beninensis]|uniref:NAD(P)/FAD-dependent oxidoreductase n=1 Tax=Periweissella beninensis TaxID=504936 RepID=A0ABT0VHA0_9LACO|nr:NAD(P)/FAD-dependent oxidoreductase [Periweissella beninensis]MBM7544723.1 NADH dehydrogenase [Periweissella beninensis]MCM2436985.1 NAD(P)/FAD-dependent oxidoreductase [Periweissella beninensis]
MAKKTIGILGAGYAGLLALKVLQSKAKDVAITLIDRNDYHYEATDLHEVAAGSVKEDKISFPIKDVVNPNITTFIKGTVTKVDKATKTVEVEGQAPMTFDYLIIALGFASETFGIKGAQANALAMDDVETAQAVHTHFVKQLEDYRVTKNPDNLKVIICGAGFTGVELLGAMAEHKAEYAKIAGVDASEIKLMCVDASPRLLPMFPTDLVDYAIKKLAQKDAMILSGKGISEVTENGIIFKDRETEEEGELNANTIIWTTGVSGSHVMQDSGFDARRNRVMVTPELQDPEDDHVYIVGDVSAVMDEASGRPYPTTAQISLVMGHTAAHNIIASLTGGSYEKFTYSSIGTICSLGNTDAIGIVGKSSKVKGYVASVVKKMSLNKSLLETGGVKELLSKGRFDLYH